MLQQILRVQIGTILGLSLMAMLGCGGSVSHPPQTDEISKVHGNTGKRSLHVTVVGAGVVSSAPAGINNCSGSCSAQFDADQLVTLTATVDSGSSFQGWSQDCPGFGTSLNCSLTMNVDRSATATFNTLPTGFAYYLSPTGSDAYTENEARGNPRAAWRTFAHALPHLSPGYQLLLLDGTYDSSNSGFLNIDCSSGAARHGTIDHPIVVAAANERQALIQGDASGNPLTITDCNYWDIRGLRIQNIDMAYGAGRDNSVADISGDHLTLRRNLFAYNNRYYNTHLISNRYHRSVINSLFEENEFYYFHRHAINLTSGHHNTLRRNYFNSRGWKDLSAGDVDSNGVTVRSNCTGYPGAWVEGTPRCSEPNATDRGDSAISLYPDGSDIVENNISEGNEDVNNIEAAQCSNCGGGNSDHARFYGNISLGDVDGTLMHSRGNYAGDMYHDILEQDLVVINSTSVNSYWRSPGSITCNHCSFFGSSSAPYAGMFISDRDPSFPGDGNYEVHVNNSLAVGGGHSNVTGFYFNSSSGSWTWSASHLNAWGNATNFFPATTDSRYDTTWSVDPQRGNCYLWLPDNANPTLKAAGTDGKDIGARVLYRYENGVLTDRPLWSTTGQFIHGALVPGISTPHFTGSGNGANGVGDVGTRLHVGSANGCAFPGGYTGW